MYNIAKRQGLPKIGDTPDNVAPNTYIFDSYRTFKQNNAAFLSKTQRDFVIGNKLYTQALYNVDSAPIHIKGGSSIKNTVKRTFITPSDSPGPAAYSPKDIKRKPPSSSVRPPGRGKLYLCKPPRLAQSAPSIPTRVDENGYYFDENGVLVKSLPDEYDTTLGPAFYSINPKPFLTTNRYKGCEWSKRSAKRSIPNVNSNPPPGSYNIETEIGRYNLRDEYIREMARLYSYVPRILEANELKILREGLPAPGQYDTNKSTLKANNYAGIYPPPLIVASERFVYQESETPAPNAYDVLNCLKRKRCAVLDIPFGSEAPRETLCTNLCGPGPAAYSYPGPIEEKISRKRNFYGTVETPFNTTAIRKTDFVARDAPYTPGPSNYTVEPFEVAKESVSCSHFKSKTTRFAPLHKTENVGPATYGISETSHKNRDRISHNTGKVPFQSRQPKCTQRISDNPGPADYLGHGLCGLKPMSFNRSHRFRRVGDNFPGPGTYYVSIDVIEIRSGKLMSVHVRLVHYSVSELEYSILGPDTRNDFKTSYQN
ncbi:putative sperm-tail PG-rich repeat protein [Trypoxylus dichotomus]